MTLLHINANLSPWIRWALFFCYRGDILMYHRSCRMMLSMYASVTNVIPILHGDSRVSGCILVSVPQLWQFLAFDGTSLGSILSSLSLIQQIWLMGGKRSCNNSSLSRQILMLVKVSGRWWMSHEIEWDKFRETIIDGCLSSLTGKCKPTALPMCLYFIANYMLRNVM